VCVCVCVRAITDLWPSYRACFTLPKSSSKVKSRVKVHVHWMNTSLLGCPI